MTHKILTFSGGTAVANQVWVAVQNAIVRVPSISASDIFIQAGVTCVLSTDALFQNTSAALWGVHTVDQF